MSKDVLEVAMLRIKMGQVAEFKTAFAQAVPLIAVQKGYIRHELRPCMEDGHKFALLVWWQTLEDHSESFHSSPEYAQWKALLHHFYESLPVVEHLTASIH